MDDNMNESGNNESAGDQKTQKKGVLARGLEKTLALSSFFATRLGVWGYTASVTMPASIRGLLVVRFSGMDVLPWLVPIMCAVIAVESLVESRRSRRELGAAGIRTVLVTTGFVMLARLLFRNQLDDYLLIMASASGVMGVFLCIMLMFFVLSNSVRVLWRFLTWHNHPDSRGWCMVVAAFYQPAVLILFGAWCGAIMLLDWFVVLPVVVALVLYLIIFLEDRMQEKRLAWLQASGYYDVSPDGGDNGGQES